MASERHRSILVLVLPIPLILSMAAVFGGLTRWFGAELGYVLGFLFYWLFWCVGVPAALLGRDDLRSLVRPKRRLFTRANWAAATLWLLVVLGALATYLPDAMDAPFLLFAIAVPVAAINGFAEELLWRGLYLHTFPDAPVAAWIYPSIPFAAWHFVPQTVFPAEGGALALVVPALFLGLTYGYITWRTESVWWAAVSHSLSGVVALGGAIAPSLHRLLSG